MALQNDGLGLFHMNAGTVTIAGRSPLGHHAMQQEPGMLFWVDASKTTAYNYEALQSRINVAISLR